MRAERGDECGGGRGGEGGGRLGGERSGELCGKCGGELRAAVAEKAVEGAAASGVWRLERWQGAL